LKFRGGTLQRIRYLPWTPSRKYLLLAHKVDLFCSLNVEMLQLQFSPRFYVGESPTPERRKGTVKKCPCYRGVFVTRVLVFLPQDILEDPSIEIQGWDSSADPLSSADTKS